MRRTSRTGGRVTIDLSDVTWLLPGGIVGVACTARKARALGYAVHIVSPNRDSVARYASRMGLGDVLVDCGANHRLPGVQHHDRTDVLLECRWADDVAIAGPSELLRDRLDEAGVAPQLSEEIAIHVYEIADNVKDHAADGGGFVCAQTYEKNSPREYVEVAVGDAGVGVLATLSERHAPTSHQDALNMAVELGVSSVPNRGNGLWYVSRFVRRVGGRLSLSSGDAYLRITQGGPYSTSCQPIAGTLVGIQVPVGRMGGS